MKYIVECSIDSILDKFPAKKEAQKDFDASVEQVKSRGYGYVLFTKKNGDEVDFFSIKEVSHGIRTV
jgi:hypothetical protein